MFLRNILFRIQKQIAVIRSNLSNLEKIGLHDNFFDLCSHSLTALKMTFSIQKQFNVNLSIADIFKASTVLELAEFIQAQKS